VQSLYLCKEKEKKGKGRIMRKVLFPLIVVILVTPAWATINITARDLGEGWVAIDYLFPSKAERARAFALDITVDAGVITEIGNFAVGDNKEGNIKIGYGIFPANFSRYITVLDTGEVESWDISNYTPVADANDPGALGGLGTSGITIEMGSLYDNDEETLAPPLDGTLCHVKCSESCQLTVMTNATRGNVVLEDATEAEVDLISGATNYPVTVGAVTAYTGPNPEQWEAVGKPDCWISSINPRQCHGDADGTSQGKQNFWVSTNDLDILIAAWNKPLASLSGNQICADFDHMPQAKQEFRVSTNDLDILIANWNKANSPAPDCQ